MIESTASSIPHTPVLVVGAGPVGLVAAIRLREQGVEVRVIDEQTAEDKRTYPVVVHPSTLRTLNLLGVSAPLEWRGHRISRLVIYTDGQRRTVLAVPAAGQVSPGAMTLPQDVLRRSLMNRLSDLGTEVEWQTRLVSLEQDPARARIGVVRRERVDGENPERRTEWYAAASETLEAEFVIGADGCRSAVRQKLNIEWVSQGKRETYAFFDAPDHRAGDEAHLVLSGGTGNSVYPLQGDTSRFTFQMDLDMAQAPGLTRLRQLLGSRMPWYAAEVDSLEWSGSAEFHPGLASRFGEGRIWLAGDSAHSTGPLGGQSLNVGIHEADDLARLIEEQIGKSDVRPFGPRYTERRRLEWQRLFGLGSSRPRGDRAQDWVKRNIARILPSLPATGDDLDDLLEQLHVRSA